MGNVHYVFLSTPKTISVFNFSLSFLVLGLQCVTIDCWEPFSFLFFLSFSLHLLGQIRLVNFNFWFTPCIVEIVRLCALYWDEFCLPVCLPAYIYLPARLP